MLIGQLFDFVAQASRVSYPVLLPHRVYFAKQQTCQCEISAGINRTKYVTRLQIYVYSKSSVANHRLTFHFGPDASPVRNIDERSFAGSTRLLSEEWLRCVCFENAGEVARQYKQLPVARHSLNRVGGREIALRKRFSCRSSLEVSSAYRSLKFDSLSFLSRRGVESPVSSVTYQFRLERRGRNLSRGDEKCREKRKYTSRRCQYLHTRVSFR